MDGRDERPIVVGVDHSDSAREAAEWAADLAAARGVPLQLVHVVPGAVDDPPLVPGPAWLDELRATVSHLGARGVDAEVLPGGAVEVLAARSGSAQMLVLGSYGEGAWSGMLAGTRAIALLGQARCPVAVVRGRAPQLPPSRGGPIVVGVDGSPAGRAALDLGADLASDLGAPLVAVHAWSDVVADGGTPRRLPEDWPRLAAAAAGVLDAAIDGVGSTRPGFAPERDVVHDTPLRALIDRAGTGRVLVVGRHGPTPRTGMMLGSTSHALAEFAPCTVVVTGPAADGPGAGGPAVAATGTGTAPDDRDRP
jgi:nucleotide-binding universal stress UspA family protein